MNYLPLFIFLILTFPFLFTAIGYGGPGSPASAPRDEIESYLKKDSEINGILLAAGSNATFHDIGKKHLKSGTLAENFQINSIRLKKGTEIRLFKSGKLLSGTLLEKTSYKGIELSANSSLIIFESGNIKLCTPLNTYKYEGLVFQKRKPLEFFESPESNIEHKLIRGTLAGDFKVNGYSLKKGTEISFDHFSDNLRIIRINKKHLILNTHFPAGSDIYFDEKGRPASVTNVKDFDLKGILFKGGAYEIDAPGAHGQTRSYRVELYPAGGLKKGILAKNLKLKGIPLMGGTEVKFFPDGAIMSGTVSRDFKIDEKSYKRGSSIIFGKEG
jgi:hypothetical protein